MQSQMPFSNRASEEPFADSAMTAFKGAPGPGRFGSEATSQPIYEPTQQGALFRHA